MAVWLPLAAVAVFLAALLLTHAGIGYARRHALLDLPGARRSHREPTPRGGGIGIVLAALIGSVLLAALGLVKIQPGFVGAVLIVALVGWIDDHRGLGRRLRLLVHLLAGLLLVSSWLVDATFASAALVAGMLVVLAVAWSINLHNFMDGINGLLALQTVFVLALGAGLLAASGEQDAAVRSAIWVAATLGFLPFNFPRARVFMGDVGSGSLGLVIAALGLWLWQGVANGLALWLVACSAFVIDASCTLLSRMCAGRPWYSAHREHLYQWLARSGLAHVGAVRLFMTWNLGIVLPCVILIESVRPPVWAVWTLTAALYLAGGVLWRLGKWYCLRRVVARRRQTCCVA